MEPSKELESQVLPITTVSVQDIEKCLLSNSAASSPSRPATSSESTVINVTKIPISSPFKNNAPVTKMVTPDVVKYDEIYPISNEVEKDEDCLLPNPSPVVNTTLKDTPTNNLVYAEIYQNVASPEIIPISAAINTNSDEQSTSTPVNQTIISSTNSNANASPSNKFVTPELEIEVELEAEEERETAAIESTWREVEDSHEEAGDASANDDHTSSGEPFLSISHQTSPVRATAELVYLEDCDNIQLVPSRYSSKYNTTPSPVSLKIKNSNSVSNNHNNNRISHLSFIDAIPTSDLSDTDGMVQTSSGCNRITGKRAKTAAMAENTIEYLSDSIIHLFARFRTKTKKHSRHHPSRHYHYTSNSSSNNNGMTVGRDVIVADYEKYFKAKLDYFFWPITLLPLPTIFIESVKIMIVGYLLFLAACSYVIGCCMKYSLELLFLPWTIVKYLIASVFQLYAYLSVYFINSVVGGDKIPSALNGYISKE